MYRELFRYQLEPGLVDQIRRRVNGKYVPGSTRFEEEIADALGRGAEPGSRGVYGNSDGRGNVVRLRFAEFPQRLQN